MRKLLTLALFCLVGTAGFASVALVQSNAGGFISSFGSTTTTFTTSAVGFSSPTTPGSLLVCVGWISIQGTSTTPFAGVGFSNPCLTSGFTWTAAHGGFGWEVAQTGPDRLEGLFLVSYIPNASVMSGTTTLTASVTNNSGSTYNIEVEFSLYEFSGLAVSPFERNVLAQTTPLGSASQNSTPNPGNVTANSAGDLIFVAYTAGATGSNGTAGAAYTLGVSATVATIGQAQYNLSASAGSQATSFGTNSLPNWGAMATVFAIAPPPSSSVPRHRGFVN